jgi:hypothetical protein
MRPAPPLPAVDAEVLLQVRAEARRQAVRVTAGAARHEVAQVEQAFFRSMIDTLCEDQHGPALAALDDRLTAHGLRRVRVEGDGACFFRATARMLYGTETAHNDLRVATCDYLATHWTRYHAFFTGVEPFRTALHALRMPTEWVDHFAIQALADMIQRTLIIHSSQESQPAVRVTPRDAVVPSLPHDTLAYAYLQHLHYDATEELAPAAAGRGHPRPAHAGRLAASPEVTQLVDGVP